MAADRFGFSGSAIAFPGFDPSIDGPKPRHRGTQTGSTRMPDLIYSGRLTSGIGSLDWGISGLTLLPTGTGALLLATTGPRGGVTAYSLGSGPATLTDHAYFDIAWSSDALLETRVLDISGTAHIAVAAGGEAGIWTFTPDASGQLGSATLLSGIAPDTGPAMDLAQGGSGRLHLGDGLNGGIRAFDWTGDSYALAQTVQDSPEIYAEDIVRILTIDREGQHYVIVAGQADAGVTALLDDESGLAATGRLGSDEGLGVMVPTDMATVEVGGRHFIVLGSDANAGESGAISVMELRASGALVPVDHVSDTLDTRFGNLLALDTVEADDRAYVLAAGGDGGITLFTLLPDGRLHLLDTITGDETGGLGAVTALEAWRDGATLRVFATTEEEAGIAEFSVSLAAQGLTLNAGRSGGNDKRRCCGRPDPRGSRRRRSAGVSMETTSSRTVSVGTRSTVATAWIASCCRLMACPTRSRISNRSWTGSTCRPGRCFMIRGSSGSRRPRRGQRSRGAVRRSCSGGPGAARSPGRKSSPRSSMRRTASPSST
jgi:hypothetical protein